MKLYEMVEGTKQSVENLKLMDYSKFHKGEQNVPIMAVVFAMEPSRDDIEHRVLSIITNDGYGITVYVYKDKWSGWTAACKIGQVIAFDGNISKDSNHKFTITAISDAQAIQTPLLKFKRRELPNEHIDNCCMVAVIDEIKERKSTTAPAKVVCSTGLSDKFILQSFIPHHKDVMEKKLKIGQIIHMGPVKYFRETYRDQETNYLSCHPNSVIGVFGNPIYSAGNASKITSLTELKQKNSGDVVSFKGVLVRDIYNGSVSICDVPTEVDGRMSFGSNIRVVLNGIPKTKNTIVKGTVVDVVAGVIIHDNVELVYVKIEACPDNKESVSVLNYHAYDVIQIKANDPSSFFTPKSLKKNMASIDTPTTSSSQEKTVATPIERPPFKKFKLE